MSEANARRGGNGLVHVRVDVRRRTEGEHLPVQIEVNADLAPAQRMLADGRRSVTDVAFALGFSSSQYFATVFKRFTHYRPREVRSGAFAKSK